MLPDRVIHITYIFKALFRSPSCPRGQQVRAKSPPYLRTQAAHNAQSHRSRSPSHHQKTIRKEQKKSEEHVKNNQKKYKQHKAQRRTKKKKKERAINSFGKRFIFFQN